MGMFGSRGGLGSVVLVKATGASQEEICLADKALREAGTKKVFIDLRRQKTRER